MNFHIESNTEWGHAPRNMQFDATRLPTSPISVGEKKIQKKKKKRKLGVGREGGR